MLRTQRASVEDAVISARFEPVEASARLTAMLGVVLIVGLFVEGLTLVAIHRLVVLHILIGLLLVPATLLKLGSVSFRFVSYYAGNDHFRKAGPPLPLLRITGPVVVVSTVSLFASGVWLAMAGPGRPSLAAGLHKGSFVIWFGSMAIHVLGHLRELPRTAFGDWLTRQGRRAMIAGARVVPVRGAAARSIIVVLSVLGGLMVMIVDAHIASSWRSWG